MKICLVAHYAYGALSGGGNGHVGGVERQMSVMSRWLAARGHEVSLLTWNEGDEGVTEIDGVRVIRMCRRADGLPGIRFFYPRWTSLVMAMRYADADVYYQNCGEYVTGQVALWCRSNNRKFVYSVASDVDCDPRLPEMKTVRERVLYRYGIKRADRIIVQTKGQMQMLKDGFGLDSVELPMPCQGPAPGTYAEPSPPDSKRCTVLWAARIQPSKRLELLVEVARKLPEVEFIVAGGSYQDNEYIRELMKFANETPNIRMLGMVARERMPALYKSAHLFCCTSSYEGFPNTFLEAWSHGLPVVSTFDPDNLINGRGLGVAVKDAAGMVDAIRRLQADSMDWSRMSRAARNQYLENHTLDAVMQRFEGVFMDVAGS